MKPLEKWKPVDHSPRYSPKSSPNANNNNNIDNLILKIFHA